jgi:hypothetical protein
MSLVGLRAAIVASIKAEVTTLKAVQPHGGRFNLAELKRVALSQPAALVAILGGPLERQGGQAVGDVQVAVFIVTTGSSVTSRDSAALAFAETISGLVCENKWKYADAKAPTGMRIDNLYSGDIDNQGVAIWSVSWSQKADLCIYDAAALDDLLKVDLKYDLAPMDGVTEAEDLVEPRGAFMSSYGGMHVSTAVATAIAVANTYQKAAGTTTIDVTSGVDMPTTNRLRNIGTATRPFAVDVAGSVTVSVDAKVTLALAKNGVVDTDSAIELQMTAAEGAEAFSLNGLASLAATDYVELWVKSDTFPGNVTLTKMMARLLSN